MSSSTRRSSSRKTAAPRQARASNGQGEARTTVDHDEIRRWVEERGGSPATIKSTERNGEAGILRIDFPGYSGEGTLEHISWDEFFQKFDESNLAFLYQEEKKGGEPSRFSKFVRRTGDEPRGKSESRRETRPSSKRSGTHANGGSRTLRNRDEIRRWVDRYNGRPTIVRSNANRTEPNALRIRFPDYSGEEMLEEISWDDFFRMLDENNWAFRYYEMMEGERDYPRCEIYRL